MRYFFLLLIFLTFKSFATPDVPEDMCIREEQKYDRYKTIINDVEKDDFLSFFYLIELKVTKSDEIAATLFVGDHTIKVIYNFTGECVDGNLVFKKILG
jgi:hypothetical protein